MSKSQSEVLLADFICQFSCDLCMTLQGKRSWTLLFGGTSPNFRACVLLHSLLRHLCVCMMIKKVHGQRHRYIGNSDEGVCQQSYNSHNDSPTATAVTGASAVAAAAASLACSCLAALTLLLLHMHCMQALES